MRKQGRWLAPSLVAGLMIASGAASAQWYGLVSAGSTDTKIKESYVPVAGATANSYARDERDTGYKLQAGYRLGQNLAIEGGYVNLGDFSITNNVTAPVVGSLKGAGKFDGWNLVAVGLLPVSSQMAVFGKLGTIYSTTKVDYTTTGAVTLAPGVAASRKRTEWNWAYGVGLSYDLTNAISIRGEWERFDGLGKEGGTGNTGTYDVNMLSVGLQFRF